MNTPESTAKYYQNNSTMLFFSFSFFQLSQEELVYKENLYPIMQFSKTQLSISSSRSLGKVFSRRAAPESENRCSPGGYWWGQMGAHEQRPKEPCRNNRVFTQNSIFSSNLKPRMDRARNISDDAHYFCFFL